MNSDEVRSDQAADVDQVERMDSDCDIAAMLQHRENVPDPAR